MLELKSRNENSSYSQNAANPSKNHLIQWNLYSHMTGIEKGLIMYINKGNQQYEIFDVERDQDILQPTLDKFSRVWLAIKNDERVPFVKCPNRFDPYREISEKDFYVNGA